MSFKFDNQLVIGALSVLVFFIFAVVYFYISYIAPLAGDSWKYYVLNGVNGNTPIWEIIATYYTTGYLEGNPRIGQLGMHISGYGSISTGLVSLFSFMLLFISGMYVVTGKLFNPSRFKDIILLFVFVAVTVHVGTQVGRVYFYSPFTTNYLLAFGLLVFFLAVVRFYQDKSVTALKFRYPLTVLAGFLAGMSNEHTVPCFVGFGVLWLFWGRMQKNTQHNYFYNFVAFLSLVIGYLALYFAPGQHKRYSSIKNDGFEALITDFPGRVIKLFDVATSGTWELIILLAITLVVLCFTAHRKSKNMIWLVAVFLSAIGMAVVILASPKIGQRLFFASYAAIGLVYVGIFYELRQYSRTQLLISVIPIIATFLFMKTAMQTYVEYNTAFQKQTAEIEQLKQEGIMDLTLKPLVYDYRANREFVYKEYFSDNPNHRNNKYRSTIFGVNSIKYEKE